MTHRPDPHARLVHALAADAAACGLTFDLLALHERPWSSATFTGHRLTLDIAITGGDPGTWLDALPDADLPVSGRIVADLAVRLDGEHTTLEVLLLEA